MANKCTNEIRTTFYAVKGKRGVFHDIVKIKKTKKNEFTTTVSSHRKFSSALNKLKRICKK